MLLPTVQSKIKPGVKYHSVKQDLVGNGHPETFISREFSSATDIGSALLCFFTPSPVLHNHFISASSVCWNPVNWGCLKKFSSGFRFWTYRWIPQQTKCWWWVWLPIFSSDFKHKLAQPVVMLLVGAEIQVWRTVKEVTNLSAVGGPQFLNINSPSNCPPSILWNWCCLSCCHIIVTSLSLFGRVKWDEGGQGSNCNVQVPELEVEAETCGLPQTDVGSNSRPSKRSKLTCKTRTSKCRLRLMSCSEQRASKSSKVLTFKVRLWKAWYVSFKIGQLLGCYCQVHGCSYMIGLAHGRSQLYTSVMVAKWFIILRAPHLLLLGV